MRRLSVTPSWRDRYRPSPRRCWVTKKNPGEHFSDIPIIFTMFFGSLAGVGFGFFSYMQAVTVAPVHCFAFMPYACCYWPSIYHPTTKNVTRAGLVLTIVLMALFLPVTF